MANRREVLGAIGGAVALALRPHRARAAFGQYARGAAAGAAPATFDFYISTTGSDSNTGSLSSPWAITSLQTSSANYSKLSSSVIGVIAGTYNVYSLCQGNTGNIQPPLTLPPGTSSAPTILASCDASGNYSARVAILDAHDPSGGAYPTTESSIIGQTTTALGNCIIDGLYLTGSYEGAMQFPGQGTGEGGPTGIVVKNCEIYDISGYENDNMGGIHLHSVTGALVHNCKIHHIYATSGVVGHNVAGILTFNCYSNIYEYNTIYDIPVGIYDKNGPNGNHTYRYNYLEIAVANSGSYAGGFSAMDDGAGGVAGDVLTVHHNIFIAPGIFTGNGGGGESNPATTGLLFYNNTCIFSGSAGPAGGSGGVYFPTAGTGTSPASNTLHYNNIYYTSDATNTLQCGQFQQGGAVTLSDYNCFSTNSNVYPMSTVNGSASGSLVNYSLATWQADFSLDANSFQQNPGFTTPGVSLDPAGYQLGAGSPCLSAGRVGGTSGGAVCDMGAWDGAVTQIGCNF